MKKIILHACCAPCASYPIKKLQEDGFRPVVFFYNPNIFPYKEYEIRRKELQNYCQKNNFEYFEKNYDIKTFYISIKGLEQEPEKGKRCSICFKIRLEETAKLAKKLNIDNFTTTLSVSPHKNSIQIFEEGNSIAGRYGLNFLEYNFKKQDGYKISRQIAKENNMYTQSYCGCQFSIDN